MPRGSRQQLSYNEWPQDLRRRWEAVFKIGDFLDEGAGAHLARTSHDALKAACGRYLGFLHSQDRLFIDQSPQQLVNATVVTEFVAYRRRSCFEAAIAIELHHLRLALRLLYPDIDWTWLLTATKRIAAQANPKRPKHHQVTSDKLYALGFALMDQAMEAADAACAVSKVCAFDYRDGLMIAMLAAFVPRRRTFTALQVGKQLVKSVTLWALDIGPEDVKNRQALDFSVSAKLSARIDLYLEKFRKRIPGANNHNGVWASNKGRPMDDGSINDTICRRTRQAFGFPVNLHRFRHAAMTFWSIHDPKNVRGGKDLLGHASFTTTETHYIMSQSRLAGRRLAQIVDQTSGK